jgi:hypothetical protein
MLSVQRAVLELDFTSAWDHQALCELVIAKLKKRKESMKKSRTEFYFLIAICLIILSSLASADITGTRLISGTPSQGNPVVVTITLRNTQTTPLDVVVKEKIDSDLKITGPVTIETIPTGLGTYDRNIVWKVNVPALSTLELTYTATQENSLPFTLHETQILYSGKQSTIPPQVIQIACRPNGVCDFGETNQNCAQDCKSTSSCINHADCNVGTACGRGLYYPIICYDGMCVANKEKCDLATSTSTQESIQEPVQKPETESNGALIYISIAFILLVVVVALLVARKAKKDRQMAEQQYYYPQNQQQYQPPQQQQPPILR